MLPLALALLSGCTASQGTPEGLLAMLDEELMDTLYGHGLVVPEAYQGEANLAQLIRDTVEGLEESPDGYMVVSYTEAVRFVYSVKQAAWDYYGREFTDPPLEF